MFFMTEKQLQLLNFIRDTIAHSGKAPTFKLMRLFMLVASNQAVEDALSILGGKAQKVGVVAKGVGCGIPSLDIHYETY